MELDGFGGESRNAYTGVETHGGTEEKVDLAVSFIVCAATAAPSNNTKNGVLSAITVRIGSMICITIRCPLSAVACAVRSAASGCSDNHRHHEP